MALPPFPSLSGPNKLDFLRERELLLILDNYTKMIKKLLLIFITYIAYNY